MMAKFYTSDTEKRVTANLQDWHSAVLFNRHIALEV